MFEFLRLLNCPDLPRRSVLSVKGLLSAGIRFIRLSFLPRVSIEGGLKKLAGLPATIGSATGTSRFFSSLSLSKAARSSDCTEASYMRLSFLLDSIVLVSEAFVDSAR